MKRYIFTLMMLAAAALSADPTVIRKDILPGVEKSSQWYERAEFIAAAPESGTLTFWLRPDSWAESDKGAYSVASLGSRAKKEYPGFEFYRQKDGSLRVLWFRDVQKKQLGTIVVRTPAIAPEQWCHIALTWQSNGKSTITKMWINGQMAGSHWLNFVWGDINEPRKWSFNNPLGWTGNFPAGKVAFGKISLYTRVLSDAEIQSLSREKLLSGHRAYIDRDFLPDTRNSITGQILKTLPGAEMIVEFADEMQQIQKKNIAA